jgi:hypothetical protein
MMNSPIENTDTAAAKDDHVIRTDPTDEITTADTQDMSLISGDHEKQRTSSTDDLEDLEQESDEDEQDHVCDVPHCLVILSSRLILGKSTRCTPPSVQEAAQPNVRYRGPASPRYAQTPIL